MVYLSIYLQDWEGSYSARPPQFLNLTTSKAKQVCETSSIFELDNVKNGAILRDFLQTWKIECKADGLLPMRIVIFPLHLSKVLRLQRKNDARSYEVLYLSRKIIAAHLKIWCSKMQPLSGNQRPDLLTSPMNMPLVLRLPRNMHLCRSSSQMSHACHCFWQCSKTFTVCSLSTRSTIPCACHAKAHLNVQKRSAPPTFFRFWLWNVLRATVARTLSTSQLPKLVRTWCALCILTSKCASRQNGVHFFDIATSTSAPDLRCFVDFGAYGPSKYSHWSPPPSTAVKISGTSFEHPEPSSSSSRAWFTDARKVTPKSGISPTIHQEQGGFHRQS